MVRRDLLLLHEVVADTERVDEVHDLVDAIEGCPDRRQVGQVALDHLDAWRPPRPSQGGGCAGEAPDVEAGVEQFGYEAAADVPGCAEYQHST